MKGAAIADVIARVESAGAEPSAEAGEASQTDGSSADGSASADVSTQVEAAAPSGEPASTSPEAPIAPDESELRAKLERDRERREARAAIRKAKLEAEARTKLEKELAEERSKQAALKGKPFLERLKEEGQDPRTVFEQMKAEALKAGTPEARIEALEKANEARVAALEAQLKAITDAREQEQRAIAAERQERAFERDFSKALEIPAVKPLLDEYDPEDLLDIVRGMRDPELLSAHAERLGVDLGVDLTDPDAEFNILHIFQVLRAQHDAHHAKKQRRQQQAAPQTSQPGTQPAEAKKPTVNGTEARNAGTTLSNDLAATSAVAAPDHNGEDHKARLKRLIEQFG